MSSLKLRKIYILFQTLISQAYSRQKYQVQTRIKLDFFSRWKKNHLEKLRFQVQIDRWSISKTRQSTDVYKVLMHMQTPDRLVGVVMIWLCKRLRHLKMYHALEHTHITGRFRMMMKPPVTTHTTAVGVFTI